MILIKPLIYNIFVIQWCRGFGCSIAFTMKLAAMWCQHWSGYSLSKVDRHHKDVGTR